MLTCGAAEILFILLAIFNKTLDGPPTKKRMTDRTNKKPHPLASVLSPIGI